MRARFATTIACTSLFLGAATSFAQESTRIVFESNAPIRFSLLSLRNPDRVVLDLEGVDLDSVSRALASNVSAGHRYIRAVRVERVNAGAVLVELELRREVESVILTAPPEGGAGYRLALDLYSDGLPVTIAPLAARRLSPPPATAPARTGFTEAILALQVNQLPASDPVLVLRSPEGAPLVRVADLRRLRMRVPEAGAVVQDGERYFPIDT